MAGPTHSHVVIFVSILMFMGALELVRGSGIKFHTLLYPCPYFQPFLHRTIPCPKHKCPMCRIENRDGQSTATVGENTSNHHIVTSGEECTYHMNDDYIEWLDDTVDTVDTTAEDDEHREDTVEQICSWHHTQAWKQ